MILSELNVTFNNHLRANFSGYQGNERKKGVELHILGINLPLNIEISYEMKSVCVQGEGG